MACLVHCTLAAVDAVAGIFHVHHRTCVCCVYVRVYELIRVYAFCGVYPVQARRAQSQLCGIKVF